MFWRPLSIIHLLTRLLFGALVLMAWTGNAMAEHEEPQVTIVSTGSSTTSTSAIVALTATNPFVSTTSTTTHETLFGSKESTHQYVKHNKTSLQQDISTGGGKTVDDMARMAGIPKVHQAAFGKMLRRHRGKLMELLKPKTMDKDRAYVFALYIEEVMKEDATLKSYGRRTKK